MSGPFLKYYGNTGDTISFSHSFCAVAMVTIKSAITKIFKASRFREFCLHIRICFSS